MIKQITLTGLKVEAIAISLPINFHHAEIIENELEIFRKSLFKSRPPEPIDWHILPPGEWKILERANEINDVDVCELMDTYAIGPDDFMEQMEYRHKQWQSYCEKYGLTNELILVKEE